VPQADYSAQNLRHRSFEGEHLDGVDFSAADIRGTNFSQASLVDANFTDSHMGIRPLAGVVLLLSAMVVSILAGVAIGAFAEVTREQLQSPDWRDVLSGVLLILLMIVFIVVLVQWGVEKAIRHFAIAAAVVIGLDFVVVFVFSGELRFRNAIPLIILLLLLVPALVAGILGRLVGGTFGGWAISLVAIMGGVAAGQAQGGISALLVSFLLVILSRRALKGDERDGPMRYAGHRIVSHRGTRFEDADLSRANFSGTNPIHSDMSGATITDTIWNPERLPYIREQQIHSGDQASGGSS
jgi:hypothetical protein